MIVHASRGPPEGRSWQFPELTPKPGRHPASSCSICSSNSAPLFGDVLEELRREGKLLAALALLDEVGMERLVRAVAEVEGGDGALTVRAADRDRLGPGGDAHAARRRRGREPAPGDRALAHSSAVRCRCAGSGTERGSCCGSSRSRAASVARCAPYLRRGAAHHAAARRRRSRAAAGAGGHHGAVPGLVRADPASTAARPRPGVGERGIGAGGAARDHALRRSVAREAPDALWMRVDCAGLLLLYPIIRRLGWARRLADPAVGPRVFQALLAGAGMRLLRPWQPGEKVEPAAGLLAGLLEEPARLGIAQVLDATPISALDLFPAGGGLAGGARHRRRCARSRPCCAHPRLPQLRAASSIVRHFLRVPGRVLIEENELRIVLEPSPWSVALHISGADDALDGDRMAAPAPRCLCAGRAVMDRARRLSRQHRAAARRTGLSRPVCCGAPCGSSGQGAVERSRAFARPRDHRGHGRRAAGQREHRRGSRRHPATRSSSSMTRSPAGAAKTTSGARQASATGTRLPSRVSRNSAGLGTQKPTLS